MARAVEFYTHIKILNMEEILIKTPHNYDMNVDWLRVYKRTNKPLWLGSVPVSWDCAGTTAEVAVPAVRLPIYK